jgi:hypothetical protein
MDLNQFGNPAKARPHLEKESLEFIPNASVEQFYDPRHPYSVLHFCNTPGQRGGVPRLLVSSRLGV